MAEESDLIALTVEVVSAFVGQNNIRADEVPNFIASTYAAITALQKPSSETESSSEPDHAPAVSVRKSLASKDHIISMIDGKPYKTLRRHLATHGMTPEEYRARYGLPGTYPMVAPTYSEARRAMAKKIGLGRIAGGRPTADPAPAEPTEPKRRGRKPKAPPA